ncbi:MAG: right-handed parallel beta-helix repeat-containing protein [Deinococcus sp.]|nr:right-handed parallel beta-helix repeat-containing protein [Deinococcus sp.]
MKIVSLLSFVAVILSVCSGAGTPLPQSYTTWYVRPDGGSPEQCTGLVNAPYPGSGTGQSCAWDHPFRALPPEGEPRIAGGDSLIIAAGNYMMGYGAPGADNCDADYPWGCFMAAIPSGPDPTHPTRILGADDSNPPELWGTERVDLILNLTDASNVEIAYLEITDHSGCVESHTGGLRCERDTFPFGAWAVRGIYAEDSANVHLRDLNIHGLASAGVHAGRLTDWTVENVRIAGNGLVGWDGDLWEGSDSNSGTMRFQRWTVEWNGCGETWPGGQPTGCWGQEAGGYGDGVGTGETGGHWIIEDSKFLHNTSDGLDLLYARIPGSFIEIRRTIAEGNDGQQIKTTGPVLIENSIIVGNCGYFDGQPFTYNVEPICRAGGTALTLDLRPGDQVTVTSSTLASEGDCIVAAECTGNCNGSEKILLRNNIFMGYTDFLQPDDRACLAYEETFPRSPFDIDYSLIDGVKDDACPGPHDICGRPPGLVSTSIDSFDAHLLPTSPAIDKGTTEGAPRDDFDGQPRDSKPDLGAYERRTP